MANGRPHWTFGPTPSGRRPPETGGQLRLLQRTCCLNGGSPIAIYSDSKEATYGESDIAQYEGSPDPQAKVFRGNVSVLLALCFFNMPFSGGAAKVNVVGI